jgi:hypothetical protein
MNIQDLIKNHPNDSELGAEVRRLLAGGFNFVHLNGEICKFHSTTSWGIVNPDRVIHSTEDGFVESDPIFAKLEDTTRKKNKDQEILSIKYEDEIFTKDNLSVFDNIVEGSMRFEVHNKWTIHSVKRLSDGAVFTIGDIVRFPTIKGYITAITEHYIAIHDVTTRIANVSHVIPKAKKLFTTCDDVDISEGDEYWYIVENNPFIDKNIPLKGIARDSNPNVSEVQKYLGSKCFSTEEKAKEYILKHNVKYTNINPNPFTITFDEVSKCSEGVTKCTHVQKFLSKLKGLKGSNVGKKEDFTILMFIDKGELYVINENRTYNDCSGKLPKNLTLKYFKDNDIPVYSIERNSDEVVFSLGDRIKSSNSAYGGIITKILSNGHVCVGGICFYITSVELT